MYFPIGWPKVLKNLGADNQIIKQIVSNRDKILFASLSDDCLTVWFCKPTVSIVYHKRSAESLQRLGVNVGVEWKPDSSMICISTSEGHLVLYNVEALSEQTAYQQYDPPTASLRRDSAELFVKEVIPSLKITLFKEVLVWDGQITRMCCISGTEILVCTTRAHLLRYRWDGSQNRDYCLDLGRIPFSVNQQVSKAEPILEDNTHVNDIEYSPLVCGFGITLNDGRAAYLTAPNLKFDPNAVQGIWAQGIDDATCARVNHKFRLIAIGRKNSQVDVFTIDEVTGGLELSHTMLLSSKDFPGDPGPVKCMRWTTDGRAVAVSWERGGVSVWSTFGALLMCSLAWDYGLNQDLSRHNPLVVSSLEWATEGYQLWMVKVESDTSSNIIQLDFVKSPLSVNPCMSNQRHLYLQADDKLYVNLEDNLTRRTKISIIDSSGESYQENGLDQADRQSELDGSAKYREFVDDNECRKQWIVLPLPATYIATNWPLRYSAIDEDGVNVCVAGRTGLAHYSCAARRWKLFGNEAQEKDFVVTGGMLWWRDYIVIGCYSILDGHDEIRFYPREARLDNRSAKIVRVQSQVFVLDILADQLVVFGADALVTIYELTCLDNVGNIEMRCVQAVDISALSHPACVVSAALCRLQDSPARARASTIVLCPQRQPDSLVINASGRLMMVQREEYDVDEDNNPAYSCLPATVLASCVESVWCSGSSSASQTQLSRALWLWCGSWGARVWLPLLTRDAARHPDTSRHTFMAKRIMLPFHLNIYPLTILFDDAILLGAENDTTLYASDADSIFSLPFCVVNRTSQVYLHQILRQLLRRNLGYHAWEIARSCAQLPYFPHSLELLLHEVLEEEATSKEPIPDAQLPSIIEFVHEFPVYLQTVVQCARKTEIALWAYLFSAAGKPKELFQECLHRKMLDTAASYLIILQNLESSAVSRQLATQLLDTALQEERWDLARDLVRFLRAIDPNDVDSPRNSVNVQAKYGQVVQSQIVSPNAEDLSVILGSMQLAGARGRSFSTVAAPGDAAPAPPAPPSARATAAVKRKKSVPARNDRETYTGTAEEFFIDMMIQRHARLLLSTARLYALGKMACALDLHLVAWLAGERERAARIDSAVMCVKRLHEDFSWPYPLVKGSEPNLHRKASAVSSSYAPSVESDSLCGDSGYMSLPLRAALPLTTGAPLSPGPVSSAGEGSVAEGGGVAWDAGAGEERRYAQLMERLHHHQCERGSHTAHVQLRYFLQLMTEASCVEWALVLAVVLRDALAVLRTTNAARAQDVGLPAVRRLRAALQDIAAWTDAECLGYKPFIMAISNQIPFLTSIINTRERRLSMVNTRVRTSSTSSLNLDTKPQPPLEVKLQPQKAQEVSKQSVRKDSPSTVPDTVSERVVVSPPRTPVTPHIKEDVSTGCTIT
ncbi:guanine nucleotide exchange factor subunit Rich isoform X2 [Pectinophora gossypiella]|uniref:guanine nucleotide exchange factor subunit Rich isoform X2 n=1 Tax=Pectinophora gossypiella TaxID=13191 RepID=UPI00214F4DF3|nr:guanine nucleotide exchange factor subunit Rich isoform X2 [Pectinophora gossypiella]